MNDQGRGRLLALAGGLLLIFLAFVAGEVALRAYQKVRGVPFFSFLPGYHEKTFRLSPFLVFGPRTDWQIPNKPNPETAHFNAQGFRTHDVLGPKPPDELRIVALGGSTTEDVWNDAGIHWPLVAEETLHEAGRDEVGIYIGAMSAYTAAHSLVRLELDVLQYQPDLVLVLHNINDLMVVYYAGSQGRPVDPNYKVKYTRKSLTGVIDDSDVVVSRLLAFIRGRLERLSPKAPIPTLEHYDLETGRCIFERNLKSIVAVARAHGSEVVLVTMPVARSTARFEDTAALARGGLLDSFPTHDRFLADFDRYNETIRQVGKELGVKVIDAANLVASEDRYFADIVHTTTEGVRAMGGAVGSKLLEILPPRPRKDGPVEAPR